MMCFSFFRFFPPPQTYDKLFEFMNISGCFVPEPIHPDPPAVISQVTAPLLQASSLDRMLAQTRLLAYEQLLSLYFTLNPTQSELGILNILLPLSSGGSFDKLLAFGLFLSAASPQPSSHSTINCTRMILFPSGDQIGRAHV